MKNIHLVTGLALGLGLVGCVTSGDVATNNKENYFDPTNVKTVDSGAVATVPPHLENIQRELDVTRGRLEEASHRIQALEADNKRLTDELAAAKNPPPPPPPAASVATAPIPVAEDLPKKTGAPLLWELAQKDIQAGRFKEALVPLEELLKTYPKDPHAFYAALGVPMLQYHLENYKEAALNFNQIIDKYPKNSETGIAWFGQGASFAKMGQKDDAKLFYEEAAKRYPKSKVATEAKIFLAKKTNLAPKDLFTTFPDWDAKAPKTGPVKGGRP
ncbi:MAG: tetratricopeptide repeat protein [Bdellovibrionales bacterium]|nr:tetratricopeptide repeat protein [Bdellovibrionales bacterium]